VTEGATDDGVGFDFVFVFDDGVGAGLDDGVAVGVGVGVEDGDRLGDGGAVLGLVVNGGPERGEVGAVVATGLDGAVSGAVAGAADVGGSTADGGADCCVWGAKGVHEFPAEPGEAGSWDLGAEVCGTVAFGSRFSTLVFS